MKTWNTPVVEEMNINETANGILCLGTELCFISHEHKGCSKPEDKPATEPEDPNDHIS